MVDGEQPDDLVALARAALVRHGKARTETSCHFGTLQSIETRLLSSSSGFSSCQWFRGFLQTEEDASGRSGRVRWDGDGSAEDAS